MIIDKPMMLEVNVTLKKVDDYGGGTIYKFDRTKTLSENTLREIEDVMLKIAKLVSKETGNITAVKAALAKSRQLVIDTEDEIKKLPHEKDEEEVLDV